ncbi:hypothetical protein P3T76_009169 [Phytophthora citrophthora]|uniref:Uncharacterized protein n=1 Tax=Phytophthora citrophthora TaxID=4793 RepID=A0AAD9LJW0_9STRA|nr:hypothetical protein P3T76_009169 [Phytophthora citrophthora]
MVKFFTPLAVSLAASAAAAAAYAAHLRFRLQPTKSLPTSSSTSATMAPRTAHQRNIDEINRLDGYDVVIVCTSTPHQAQYWQDRLMATRGSISPKDAKVIAVFEDWDGGAGNGLGTLYAYTKAVAAGKELYGIDIPALLASGSISVALYHTAGKGTRLAPLPGSENNNKSGVKLPAMVEVEDKFVPMTILEAVVKQTGVYASSRRGRLSVFWGDQVFIPSAEVKYEAKHHIDILAALAPMPSEKEWMEKGLEKYGLIVVNQQDNAAQVDKVTHETAIRLLSSFGEMKSVGTSLGSFSVDADMLRALLSEFSKELDAKSGKLDSDPHFWMPLTLELDAYTEVMAQKGVDKTESTTHYQRMQKMMTKFEETRTKELGLFGCVDVGSDVYWWDYGQLKLYLKNNRLVTKPGVEADCLRLFLGISNSMEHSQVGVDAVIKEATVLNSEIEHGDIKNSVLSGVCAKEVNANGSILINVTARSITAPNCVVYNVTSDEADGLCLEEGSVVVGVLLPDGKKVVMRSSMEVCGGKAWKTVLEENQHSFEKIYELNADANVSKLEQLIQAEHMKMREVLLVAALGAVALQQFASRRRNQIAEAENKQQLKNQTVRAAADDDEAFAVEIEYCTGCRWMLRAAWMAQELLTTFQQDENSHLRSVTLTPNSKQGGVFNVYLREVGPNADPDAEPEMLWSRKIARRFPESKELKQLVRDIVCPERGLGHSDKK